LGIAYDYLGELHRSDDAIDDAEKAYHRALDIQRTLVEEDATAPEFRQELSRTHNNFGLLLTGTNRTVEAEDHLKQARQLLDQLVQSFPEDGVYQEELARTNINLGVLWRKTGEIEKAKQAYEFAAKRLEAVVQQFPNVHDYQYKLGVSLVNLGNLLAQESPASKLAGEKYQHAIQLLEELAAAYPRIPLYRKELANAYNSLALLYARQENRQRADDYSQKAQSAFEQLLADSPDVPEYKSLLGMTLGGRAWLMHDEPERAKQLVEAAIEQQKMAYNANPDRPEYRQRLAEHYIFLAEVLIKQMNFTAASERIEMATELGYADTQRLAELEKLLDREVREPETPSAE
jgi:tetratricopeptide (TPR) repeat protein